MLREIDVTLNAKSRGVVPSTGDPSDINSIFALDTLCIRGCRYLQRRLTSLSMSSAPMNIASAIQSASIKRHPSPHHDLNPSTAASSKQPVEPASPTSVSSDANSIPESALKPTPRRANLPPLPDMRFEQSYLASLQGAESYWTIAWITGRDHVLQPETPNPQHIIKKPRPM